MISDQKNKKIFVGGLPSTFNYKEAFDSFKTFISSLYHIELPMVRTRGSNHRNKGFAILHVEDEEEYAHLLEKKFFYIGNRKVTMREYLKGSKLQEKRKNELKKRIFIAKLPLNLSLAEVRKNIQKQFGEVEDLFRLQNPTTKEVKPCALCFFKSEKSAKNALKQKNLKVGDMKLIFEEFDQEMKEKFKEKLDSEITQGSKPNQSNNEAEAKSEKEKLLNKFMVKPTKKQYFKIERQLTANSTQYALNYRINPAQPVYTPSVFEILNHILTLTQSSY